MQPRGLSEEYGTTLLRAVADCQHLVEILTREFIYMLRTMGCNVDSEFFHDGDRIGANGTWLGARTFHYERFPDSCRNMPSAICDRAE